MLHRKPAGLCATQMAATKKLTWVQLQVLDQSVAKVCVDDRHRPGGPHGWWMGNTAFSSQRQIVWTQKKWGAKGELHKESDKAVRCALKQLPLFTSAFMPYCYWCKVQHTAIVPFLCNCSWGFMLFRELVDCIAQWQTSACCFLIVWLYNCLGKQVSNKFCKEHT